MKYSWYQTSNRDYRFESLDYAQENGFKISDYDLVLEGDLEEGNVSDGELLEFLYTKMNTDYSAHPGVRSMSVSDIVLLSDNDGWNIRAYYCDDIGWSKLDFWKDM